MKVPMKFVLEQLREKVMVGVVSGSDFVKVEEQLSVPGASGDGKSICSYKTLVCLWVFCSVQFLIPGIFHSLCVSFLWKNKFQEQVHF